MESSQLVKRRSEGRYWKKEKERRLAEGEEQSERDRASEGATWRERVDEKSRHRREGRGGMTGQK